MGTFFAGDFVTGLIRVRSIPASAGDAEAILNSPGTINCSVHLPLIEPTTGIVVPFSTIIEPNKSFLGYEENGKIINAGPIQSDVWDLDSQTMKLSAIGALGYFQQRNVLPLLAAGDPIIGADTTIDGVSLRTIIKRLVVQAESWPGGSFPTVYESDYSGTAARTYLGADLQNLYEKIGQINAVIDGPDSVMRPRFVVGDSKHIEWVLLTGAPEIVQGGPDHVWDASAAYPTITGASVTRDGTAYSTNDYEVGDQIIEWASDSTLITNGFPMTESNGSHSSVIIPATLDDYAQGVVEAGKHPLETWKFSALLDGPPAIQNYDEGDYAVVVTNNDPRLGTGRHRVRILSYKATLGSQFVTITCAPDRTV